MDLVICLNTNFCISAYYFGCSVFLVACKPQVFFTFQEALETGNEERGLISSENFP